MLPSGSLPSVGPALYFFDMTAQSQTLSPPISAYLRILKPDSRIHFPFPLPENVFVFSSRDLVL